MNCGHTAEEHAAYIRDKLGAEAWDIELAVLTTVLEYQDTSYAVRKEIEQNQEQEQGSSR